MVQRLPEPSAEDVAAVKTAIKTDDMAVVVPIFFRDDKGGRFLPAPGQVEIIERIAKKDKLRVLANCYTRYGKSDAVSIGILWRACRYPAEKIVIIAPTHEQARIIMNYVGRHLGDHPFLRDMLSDSATSQRKQLDKEISHSRRTFKNNSEIRILSANITKGGQTLMGHGADMVIVDECEGIPTEIITGRVTRMLGDDPENSMLFLISNPTQRGYMYQAMHDPVMSQRWETIHIGWQRGVDEGRTTEAYIMERAEEMGGMESVNFQILYESRYPLDYEDQLIPYAAIMDAVKPYTRPSVAGETHRIIATRHHIEGTIMGVDPAHLGADEAVIIDVDVTNKGEYLARGIKTIATCTVPELIGIVRQRYVSNKDGYTAIKIDYQGLQGVVDGLKDQYPGMAPLVHGIKHGESAQGWNKHGEKYSSFFHNRKAQNYWRLRELFMSRLIRIPRDEKLIEQLMGWKYEHTPAGRIKMIDPPGKSPDRSDALCYAIADVGNEGDDTGVYVSGWAE